MSRWGTELNMVRSLDLECCAKHIVYTLDDKGSPVRSELAQSCCGWRVDFDTLGFHFVVENGCLGSTYAVTGAGGGSIGRIEHPSFCDKFMESVTPCPARLVLKLFDGAGERPYSLKFPPPECGVPCVGCCDSVPACRCPECSCSGSYEVPFTFPISRGHDGFAQIGAITITLRVDRSCCICSRVATDAKLRVEFPAECTEEDKRVLACAAILLDIELFLRYSENRRN